MRVYFGRLMSSVGLTAMLVSPAFAQESVEENQGGIKEIVVTAQKRAENVQDVPIAISAFTADALSERAVTSVASLSNIAPNVTLDAGTPFSGSSAVLSAYIRGIGANDFAFNIDPGVGIYLDGVYLARSVGANQELPDVERVEVLKGPQGTLFGRNTIGGAISIVTHDPGKEFRFKGDVTTGRFGLIQTRGTVDLPLADSLSSSFSFATKNRKGYLKRIAFPGFNPASVEPITSFVAAGYENIGLGREGGDDTWNVRGKLKYDNGGALKATISGDYSNVDQNQLANKLIATSEFVPGPFAGLAANNLVTPGGATALDVVTGSSGFLFAGLYNFCISATAAQIAARNAGNLCGPRSGLSFNSLPGLAGASGRTPYDSRFVTNNIDTSYANGNNYSKLKTYGGSLILDYDVSDSVALKSVTGYRELHWNVGMDVDGSPLNFLHTSFTMNQKQFSQELQLLGNALDERLNYVFGAYYFKESGDLHDYVTFAEGLLQVDGPNDLSTKNYAFFGQVDFKPTEQFGITIGGRYTHESKLFEGFQSDRNGFNYKLFNALVLGPDGLPIDAVREAIGFPNANQPLRYYLAGTQKKVFNNFSPKVGLQYHPMDDVMLYGSWSKGYKTGGWTTRLSNPQPIAPGFDEEKATTFELGVKSTLIDRRLQVNAAVFQTNYKGIQLNFQQGTSPTIQNAGDAKIKGFELEVTAAPADGLTLNASVGYLDSSYKNVLLNAQVAANPFQAGVFPGATLPKSPKWKFNVSPRYELDLGDSGSVVLLADYTHSSSLWNDTERAYLLQRASTDLLNGSITYKAPEHWDITLGMTNITDERYLVTGQAQIAGGQFYGTYSRPREWYAKLGIKF
jgi:iron complex outermembrane recepter protein